MREKMGIFIGISEDAISPKKVETLDRCGSKDVEGEQGFDGGKFDFG